MLDKLRVDASWLDRMGISETERSPPEIAGDDSRCTGLSDVASLWQGENIYIYINISSGEINSWKQSFSKTFEFVIFNPHFLPV